MTNEFLRPDNEAVISYRFKKLRCRVPFTQRELARMIGICCQTISEIETEKVMPHDKTWGLFADLEAKHMQPPLGLPAHWD